MNFLAKIQKPIVPIVYVSGGINFNQVEQLTHTLAKINFGRAKALAVIVNSTGGMMQSAAVLAHKLKHAAQEHHIPLHMFAQDYATSAAYFILCQGDSVYADATSAVGNIGVIQSFFNVSELLNKNKIEYRKFFSNPHLSNKSQIDPFGQWDQNVYNDWEEMLKYYRGEFVSLVQKQRQSKLKQDNLDQIFNGHVYNGKEALDQGLVDEIGSYEAILRRLYPNYDLKHYQSKSMIDNLRESF